MVSALLFVLLGAHLCSGLIVYPWGVGYGMRGTAISSARTANGAANSLAVVQGAKPAYVLDPILGYYADPTIAAAYSSANSGPFPILLGPKPSPTAKAVTHMLGSGASESVVECSPYLRGKLAAAKNRKAMKATSKNAVAAR
ncbi:hypothetical protein Q1695_004005 [Nippostrongylus brasiliensis]|nr:hypothetical protein Q1695_004005 [Nippostrongylus brasiliensis]